MAGTNSGTSGGKKCTPWFAMVSKTNAGTRRKAESASQRIPNRRMCPAIRPLVGINGGALNPFPQDGQKFCDSCNFVPQRSQYIANLPEAYKEPDEGAACFVRSNNQVFRAS